MRPSPKRSRASLLVVDFWEKLAGASLALSAIIRLCQGTGLSLVAPTVHSSLFLPAGGFALSTYYDIEAMRAALAPQRLVSHFSWQRLRRRGRNDSSNSTNSNRSSSLSVAVIYSDFPSACRGALAQHTLTLECPQACLAAAGLRRLVASAQQSLGAEVAAHAPLRCVAAAELRSAIQGHGGRLHTMLSQATGAVELINFRRHDAGKPMLPPAQALALRAAAVRPAAEIRAAARRFVAWQLPAAREHGYAVVQLRSNHLAHAAYVAHGPGALSDGSSASCQQHIGACVRRLGRAARRHAPPSATIVASDLSTLFEAHQDGASHRRHGYMRECLLPSLPSLHRWFTTQGRAFQPNCTAEAEAAPVGVVGVAPAASTRSSRPRRGAEQQATQPGCDAGVLGLIDLVLSTEATAFVAVAVSQPWRSAFLEWIVQARRLAGRTQTELISC